MDKTIPIFDLPEIKPRTLGGRKCTVRRLRATEAPRVLTKMIADFGTVVTEYICSSDPRDLVAQAKGLDGATKDKLITAGVGAIKVIVASEGLKNILERFASGDIVSFRWYLRKLLCKKLSVDGVVIANMDELDATQAPTMVLAELLLFAFEVNFDPTLGGLSMSLGPKGHQSQGSPEPETKPPKIQTRSNVVGANGRTTGRAARRRAASNGSSTSP